MRFSLRSEGYQEKLLTIPHYFWLLIIFCLNLSKTCGIVVCPCLGDRSNESERNNVAWGGLSFQLVCMLMAV